MPFLFSSFFFPSESIPNRLTYNLLLFVVALDKGRLIPIMTPNEPHERMHFDIFNGDADGILSLLQLRLVEPKSATLVTGVKRDIQLLERVDAQSGDTLTVLDISMAKNQPALQRLLAAGASVFYADHHQTGDIPQHSALDAHIHLNPNMCTALIIDELLQGQCHEWAITAAYGDNLIERADALAQAASLDAQQRAQLCELGTLINYNGYGADLDDLHMHPADLFQALLPYASPFDMLADPASPYVPLKQAYREDMAQIHALQADYSSEKVELFRLEDSPTSRRISGILGNQLANQTPQKAHVVVTTNPQGALMISLRAPLANKQGAGTICSQFATGGGREAAAGINALAEENLPQFIAAIEAYY